jgi:hypothetical protein
MADVTGPNSGLPGQRRFLPAGTVCDEHPDTPAVARIQGETDSMGSEMIDMCQICYDNFLTSIKPREGRCDWCGCVSNDLKHHRDLDEGSSGRVYDVCQACISAENERVSEELGPDVVDDNDDSVFPDDLDDDDNYIDPND